MASQEITNSKLAEMKMRFQQKQQVERNQKRTELSGSRKNAALFDDTADSSKIFTSTLRAGKSPQFNSNKLRDNGRRGFEKKSDFSSYEAEKMIDSTSYLNSSLKTIRKQLTGLGISNSSNNNNTNNSSNNSSVKLKPISDMKIDDKILNPKLKINQIRSNNIKASVPRLGTISRPITNSSSTNTAKTPTSAGSMKSQTTRGSSNSSAKRLLTPFNIDLKNSTGTTNQDGTISCRICGRSFNEDRIAKHEDICENTATKKRKIFDTTKHRVKGTDAEKFIKKPNRPGVKKPEPIIIPRKADWRRKHIEFIQAIRSAKEMQAHLARGGKLSDLPPPPPSENPDYVQCPHCMRRFNQGAADRHIPKCATFKHNKPKPNVAKITSKARY